MKIIKIQKRFDLISIILLQLMTGYSHGASIPDQPAPIPAAAQPAEHPRSPAASFFHDQLAPYGQWFWLDPYGWVWTPSNVDAAWRPYTDGGWVYADSGWTWVSDQEWGWAPFHYGRWFFHDHRGWCWMPGSEWAPAWVAWHWGNDWCGWAPMPPQVAWETCSDWDAVIPTYGWCFVDHRDFRHHHLKDHIALVARNGTLLHATKDVTHFEVHGRSVVNLSITPQQVEKATGRPVQRFSITEINSPGGTHGALSGKSEISIYRPVVKETKATTLIRRQATATPGQPNVTFDQLRRDEAAHRGLQAQQARDQATLEQLHQSELRTPPPGLSAPELMQRHQAEHRAFNEHVNRQNQVFEYRQQSAPAPFSAPQEGGAPMGSPQQSGGGSGKNR